MRKLWIICIVCSLLLGGCSSRTAALEAKPAECAAAFPQAAIADEPTGPKVEDGETPSGDQDSRQPPTQDFFRQFYAGFTTPVGCLFLPPADHELLHSIPRQEACAFRVVYFPEGQYEDPAEFDIDAAQIFADTGCMAEVYSGSGTEKGLDYNGTVCFVTTTPERMWELGMALGDGETGDFFFVERQYDSVKQRFNTLLWSSKDA